MPAPSSQRQDKRSSRAWIITALVLEAVKSSNASRGWACRWGKNSQQSTLSLLARRGLFLLDSSSTMSRVRIIFLNRSCAQLHSLSLLPPPTTSSYYIPTTATAYLVERMINCHNSCCLKRSSKTLRSHGPFCRCSSRLVSPPMFVSHSGSSVYPPSALRARAMSIFLLNEVVLSKLLVLTQPTMTGTEVWWMS